MKIVSHKSRSGAWTLVELCVLIAVIAILCVLVFSGAAFGHSKQQALRVICANNLKYIGLALDSWASDHHEKFPMEISQTNGGTMEFKSGPNEWRHFQVMTNEFASPKVLLCPADDLRPLAATNFTFFNNSNLSFFINLDYSRPNPSAIWSGDRNLTNGAPTRNGILEVTTNQPTRWTAEMHHKHGNLLLFDGSVSQVNEAGLRKAIENSGAPTNRLQMPVLGP